LSDAHSGLDADADEIMFDSANVAAVTGCSQVTQVCPLLA